jgi:hypothetical protein
MRTRQVTAALKRAFKLIDTEDKFTRDAYARDASGVNVFIHSDSAVCFCSAGALLRSTGGHVGDSGIHDAAYRRLHLAALKFGHSSPIGVNDEADYATVRAMWELAIAGSAPA